MAWIEPLCKDFEPIVDVNAKIRAIKGNLDEEEARILLGEFLTYNTQFLVEILMGFKLHPRQVVLLKTWFDHNYNLAVWGRGASKSTLAGVFSVLYCLMNPGHNVLIVSQNFRSSRRILENLEKLAQSPEGSLFRQCVKGDLSRRNDIYKYTFINGATVTAVPLSGGDGLRGLRCQVLLGDEASLLSLRLIEEILKPFLIAGGDIKSKLKIRERETRMIKKGLMREEDRQMFASTSKMILLGSASYQWEDFYKIYQDYRKHAENDPTEEYKVASYCVTQLSYKAVPEDLLDKGIIKDVEGGDISQTIVDKEYGARFVADSAGYFSAKKMQENCTIPDGQRPTIEIVGEKGAEYVLGIDPSFSSAEHSDDFAMSLLKIVPKDNEKKIGLLVHSYAVSGGNLKDHILYLHYVLTNFKVVYIAIDASQGDNEFTASANSSSLFKQAGITLNPIEADFNKDDLTEIPSQIKSSYNREGGRIVQKQGFNSNFQRAANEYLQACIDYKNILFASKATACDGVGDELASNNIPMLREHPSFKEDSIYDFIETQDSLIDLTKKECALIEVSSSPNGLQCFDLPASLKRTKSKTRARKDNYSSLLIANWGLKLYLQSQAVETEEIPDTFTPFAI